MESSTSPIQEETTSIRYFAAMAPLLLVIAVLFFFSSGTRARKVEVEGLRFAVPAAWSGQYHNGIQEASRYPERIQRAIDEFSTIRPFLDLQWSAIEIAPDGTLFALLYETVGSSTVTTNVLKGLIGTSSPIIEEGTFTRDGFSVNRIIAQIANTSQNTRAWGLAINNDSSAYILLVLGPQSIVNNGLDFIIESIERP